MRDDIYLNLFKIYMYGKIMDQSKSQNQNRKFLQFDFYNEQQNMKKPINLSDVVKERLQKLSNTEQNLHKEKNLIFNENIKETKIKHWPNINKHQSNLPNFQTNRQTNKHTSKSNNSIQYQKTTPKLLDKSISRINDSINSSKKQKGRITNNLGLSTLMDISVSTIRQSKTRGERKQLIKNSRNKDLLGLQIQEQILQMRQKLQRIQQNQLYVGEYQPYNPLQAQNPYYQMDKSEQKYLKELKQQIMNDNLRKLTKTIKKIFMKILLRELQVKKEIQKIDQRKRQKLLKTMFYTWKQYLQNQSEKKIMMDAIRERIIMKRNQKKLDKQLQDIINDDR